MKRTIEKRNAKIYLRDYQAANDVIWRALLKMGSEVRTLNHKMRKAYEDCIDQAASTESGITVINDFEKYIGLSRKYSETKLPARFTGAAHALLISTSLHVQAIARSYITKPKIDRLNFKSVWDAYRFKSGPKIRSVYWAEGVIAGGNFVRHFDDWYWKVWDHYGGWGENSPLQLSRAQLAKVLDPSAVRNIEILEKLGIRCRDYLFREFDMSFQICKTLRLNTKPRAVKQLHDWTSSIALKQLEVLMKEIEEDERKKSR